MSGPLMVSERYSIEPTEKLRQIWPMHGEL